MNYLYNYLFFCKILSWYFFHGEKLMDYFSRKKKFFQSFF